MAFDIPKIKDDLKSRIGDLVAVLAPGGAFKGDYYMPINPTRSDDTKPGSFFICISGAKAGGWMENVSGDKGDVINLIQYCMGYSSVGDALHWATKWLDGEAVSNPNPKPLTAKNPKPEQSDEEKKEGARRWFIKGGFMAGSRGEIYLRSRGIELDEWPRALRFFKELKHSYSGQSFPCIMAAYTNPKGCVVAVHRTYLAVDGSDKAPVGKQARLSWPSGYGGSVIRLSKGDGKILVIVEGLEDGLSVMMACPHVGVWMAGALWNIERLRLPKTEQVIIFADNDWGKPEAEALLMRGVAAYKRQEANVLLARSPIGKDANDGLRKGGVSVVQSAILEAMAA